jgi:hypothetical protein
MDHIEIGGKVTVPSGEHGVVEDHRADDWVAVMLQGGELRAFAVADLEPWDGTED